MITSIVWNVILNRSGHFSWWGSSGLLKITPRQNIPPPQSSTQLQIVSTSEAVH